MKCDDYFCGNSSLFIIWLLLHLVRGFVKPNAGIGKVPSVLTKSERVT